MRSPFFQLCQVPEHRCIVPGDNGRLAVTRQTISRRRSRTGTQAHPIGAIIHRAIQPNLAAFQSTEVHTAGHRGVIYDSKGIGLGVVLLRQLQIAVCPGQLGLHIMHGRHRIAPTQHPYRCKHQRGCQHKHQHHRQVAQQRTPFTGRPVFFSYSVLKHCAL